MDGDADGGKPKWQAFLFAWMPNPNPIAQQQQTDSDERNAGDGKPLRSFMV
jgi:hypothetical protein